VSGSLGVRLRLVQIATLESPLAMAIRAADDALYIGQKGGKVIALRGGKVDPTPVLDISSQVSTGSEQGLLGLAFSPDGQFLYVNFTNVDGDTTINEYPFADGSVTGPPRRVLFVRQPYPNHNGGDLVFGPDGDLYIGLGDGGSEGDPQGNGQNLSTLLGKMLRIDPRPSGLASYTVPPDNPFVGKAGVRPEIWAYGLRNPWRYSFDRSTGDLWIGDVGQNAWEEVDYQAAGSKGGENYGWNAREGNDSYQGSAPAGAVPPVFEYGHGSGECAVTGGYVYRGSAIPALQGAYVFADFCLGDVVAIRIQDGRVVQQVSLGLSVPSLSSFAEDQSGELYALSLVGALYRLEP